jgi:cation transport regulator ChaC
VHFAQSVPAVLKGYRLICNIPSRYRAGGIFNLQPDPGGVVHGVAYELHPGDSLSAAMIKEGESTHYVLALNTIQTAKGKNIQAFVLLAETKSKTLAPSSSYLDVVIRAARQHRLPTRWISRLQAMGPARRMSI